mgnify:FL=1
MTEYFKRSTAEVQKFVKGLSEAASDNEQHVFDSAAGAEFVETNIKANAGVAVPDTIAAVFDEAKDDAERNLLTRAILDGCKAYEKAHGMAAPADVIEQAFHSAYATTNLAHSKYHFDSADSNHSDNGSLQPNRAVVAILSTLTEAIPFAHYLPADIGSNEAKLAILSHQAGTLHGAYAVGGSLDGVNSGNPYLTSARVHTSNPDDSGNVTGKLTRIQTDFDHCNQSGEAIKIMRGRTIVYVNGRPAAYDVGSGSTAESPISGSIDVGGKAYSITGTINVTTGEYSLLCKDGDGGFLAKEVPVTVEGFIDYEQDASITPSVIAEVETFKLYANPWRAYTRQSIDARTQMTNELGLDPYSESVLAINSQFANERHYQAIAKGLRLAQNNVGAFDFGEARKHQDNARSEVWRDMAPRLGELDQKMAEATMSHGISHLYVGKKIAAELMGLSAFEPSGISARPGIYRLGRLFKKYDVYYTPKLLNETESSAQILCIGRAPDVARNPIVLGEAVAPSVMPLGLNADLRQGAGFYARNFTCVNPHDPSAHGFALLNVTNLNAA